MVSKFIICSFVNSGVTEPNVTKFIHNIENSLPLNILKSELWSSKPFRNAVATEEGEKADLAGFVHKIGCHSNVP